MSEDKPKRETILALYHEIYTNLQTEADDQIITAINDALKPYPKATYQQIIASLKLYLLGIIDNMLQQTSQQVQDMQQDQSQETQAGTQ